MTAPRLLTTEAAAKYLSLAAGTLENMRYENRGPKVTRLGRAVRYDKQDLDAWVDQQKAS